MEKISVLIVDDSTVDRYILIRQLKKIGIVDIFEKDDGSSALEFLENYEKNAITFNGKFPPVIIFLDINMPRIGGFEFLERFEQLRNRLQLKSCVIMMFSSSERPEDKERAMHFDFVKDFLTKGELSVEELKSKIEAI